MTIEEIYKIIQERQKNQPADSYVASLFKKGNDRIVQKIGEESIEVIIAAKNQDRNVVISEVADLWFHILVLLVASHISFEEILIELENRNKSKQTIE